MFRIAVPCILLILSPVLTLTLKPSSVVRTFPNTSKRPILKPQIELNRRCVFQTILSSGVALGFGSSNANAFDAEQASRDIRKKINEAVTESELGISVRKSVVRGAQVMDRVDGDWERLSDRFGLGTERSRRQGRPLPKVIPDPLPLNSYIASSFLSASDDIFISLVSDVSSQNLAEKITRIDSLVRKSFERSGVSFDHNQPISALVFNYWSYVHYRAYCELIIENKVDFIRFRKRFETALGLKIIESLKVEQDSFVRNGLENDIPSMQLKQSLNSCITNIDLLLNEFRTNGFVALCERSTIESESINDWASDLSDLQFSIALDGDVTLNAQILLQEQGYRLIPDFPRFAVMYALNKCFSTYGLKEDVDIEEYYMDTDYNSDPDKFEVKEVLLNVVIESS